MTFKEIVKERIKEKKLTPYQLSLETGKSPGWLSAIIRRGNIRCSSLGVICGILDLDIIAKNKMRIKTMFPWGGTNKAILGFLNQQIGFYGISHREVSRRCGMTEPWVSSTLRRRDITINSLVKITDALDIDFFVGGEKLIFDEGVDLCLEYGNPIAPTVATSTPSEM